jgi:hypothetical protein
MRRHPLQSYWTWLLVLLVVGATLLPDLVSSQEEVASAIRRYKDREASTGYYEQYEAKPFTERPLVGVPGVGRGIFPYSPSGAEVRNRARLADSHAGIKFYQNRRCEECHVPEAQDAVHTIRGNITCRQCHGGEPIASIQHYYSPLNPIRRHAFVCAKCHEDAGASFASYVVHAPNPAKQSTQKTFPMLFYVFWVMVGIAVLTFAVFLPHSLLWGIRELFQKKEKPEDEHREQD